MELNVNLDKWEIPLGQITLEEVIGSGAFGTVWRATLSRGNGKLGIRFVAAKCFSRKYDSAFLIYSFHRIYLFVKEDKENFHCDIKFLNGLPVT